MIKSAALALIVLPLVAYAQSSDVVKRFAPVVLQRCHGEADYITNFDYDGNWNGADNWENLEKFPKKAYVYASAIETKTHWYLTYAFFHPRDWLPVHSLPHINHENDLEGALVVVEKLPAPHAVLMETIAHHGVLKWTSDAQLSSEEIQGPLKCDGDRPIVDIAPWKHPVSGYTGDHVEGERGIIYRYHARAEEPVDGSNRDVSYDLLSIKDTLWARRNEVGPDKAFGEADDFFNGHYGSAFNGDDYTKNGANPPWSWGEDAAAHLKLGDWFFDPAKAVRTHFPKQKDRFSTEYLAHPFKTGR